MKMCTLNSFSCIWPSLKNHYTAAMKPHFLSVTFIFIKFLIFYNQKWNKGKSLGKQIFFHTWKINPVGTLNSIETC